ncbi:MAG: sialidase family protein [Phaeospirillum sp.]|nr:sialidase family protein [Phaeospirillum sp.]
MKRLALALTFMFSVSPALAHDHAPKPRVAVTGCAEPILACARSATPAFGPGGKVWIVWSAAGQVFVSASQDRGGSFAEPVAVSEQPPATIDDNGEARPKLLALADGTLVVVYGVRVDKSYNAVTMISRSTDGGQSFSTPVRLLDEVGQRFETLVAAPGGRLYLAWLDRRNQRAAKAAGQIYNDTGVAVAWSDDGGVSFAGKRILADYSCDCCRLAATIDRDGLPVYAWRHVYGKNLRDHAVAKLSADGAALTPLRVSEDEWAIDACPMHGPSLSVDPAGSWHVAWYTAGKRRQGLFYARSDDGGVTFSEPQGFGHPARPPSRPQVMASGEQVWRLWKEFDGVTTTVMAQSSADHGQSWDAPRPVAATADASDHPLLVNDGAVPLLSWLTRAEGYRLLPLAPSH